LPERFSVGVPRVANDICRSAVPTPKYLLERRSTAFPHHYTPGDWRRLLMVRRTIESLYEELVSEGIIVRPQKCSLADYVGECSFLGTTLRQANIEPMPSLSDVRRLVTEYTILPLGTCEFSCPVYKISYDISLTRLPGVFRWIDLRQ